MIYRWINNIFYLKHKLETCSRLVSIGEIQIFGSRVSLMQRLNRLLLLILGFGWWYCLALNWNGCRYLSIHHHQQHWIRAIFVQWQWILAIGVCLKCVNAKLAFVVIWPKGFVSLAARIVILFWEWFKHSTDLKLPVTDQPKSFAHILFATTAPTRLRKFSHFKMRKISHFRKKTPAAMHTHTHIYVHEAKAEYSIFNRQRERD